MERPSKVRYQTASKSLEQIMIGSGFNLRRTSRPASAANPHAGVLNGRILASSFAASPRISYKSTWWAAVKQGGFAGWRQLIVRNVAERNLTDADRTAKIKEIKSAIHSALKSPGSNTGEWRKNFDKILSNAAWYEVDVDAEVRSALQTMADDKLVALRKACVPIASWKFLLSKIAERVADIGEFKDQFRGEFFRSAMLYSEGYLLEGYVQDKQWKKIDKLLDSFGSYDLTNKVAVVISDANPWQLLPFAEHHCKKIPTSSPALEEFRRQANAKLKKADIKFGDLTDKELGKFSELFKDSELSHHASACDDEIKKRLHAARCNALELHLEKRMSSMVNSRVNATHNDNSVSENALFKELTDRAVSIALKVVKKSDPEVVVALSKLNPEVVNDACLINTAKAYLNFTDVKSMEHAHLIAYLKMAPGNISESARELLVAEATKRVEKGINDCFNVLSDGLNSNSCHELVRAVREFSMLADSVATLKSAAGLKKGWGKLPEDFSMMLMQLDSHKIMRARIFVTDLIQHGNTRIADLLSKAIKGLRSIPFIPLTARDNQFMAEAISFYFPTSGFTLQSASGRPVDRTLGGKLLSLFHDKCLGDAIFRMVRAPEGKELPVCEKFVLDQRNPMQAVNGEPIFVSYIPKEIDKAAEFVRKMNSLVGVTEEQILMASRIATQSTANSFVELTLKEKLFSLTPSEAGRIRVGATTGWMHPLGLRATENFTMQNNGNLIVQVKIFNENVESWTGEILIKNNTDSVQVKTVPEKSSVSVELRFEIDGAGKIISSDIENLVCNRELA